MNLAVTYPDGRTINSRRPWRAESIIAAVSLWDRPHAMPVAMAAIAAAAAIATTGCSYGCAEFIDPDSRCHVCNAGGAS